MMDFFLTKIHQTIIFKILKLLKNRHYKYPTGAINNSQKNPYKIIRSIHEFIQEMYRQSPTQTYLSTRVILQKPGTSTSLNSPKLMFETDVIVEESI